MVNPAVTKSVKSGEKLRQIRSFARRSGRLRPSQRDALENFWDLYGISFQDHELDINSMLNGFKNLKVEVGFGVGSSLVQMAISDPDSLYLGIEVHQPGIGNCIKLIREQNVGNLKLIQHDAIEVLQYMLPEMSVDKLFLFFPDPWHKTRHNKRRIVNQLFRDLIFKILKPQGILHMATDWQHYAEHMAKDLLADSRFENLGNKSAYAAKPDYRPQTKFERRGLKLGHGVWDLLFRKL